MHVVPRFVLRLCGWCGNRNLKFSSFCTAKDSFLEPEKGLKVLPLEERILLILIKSRNIFAFSLHFDKDN